MMAALVTRLALISDTHNRHKRVGVPDCDVLVHAGDATKRGSEAEMLGFLDWLAAQPAQTKIFVAGNCDAFAEREPQRMRTLAEQRDIRYLDDNLLEADGLKIWGTPVTPAFQSMAFNRERGPAIKRHWDAIPDDIDVLITHGPPRGLGDRIIVGMRVGCVDLLARVQAVAPRLHVFGHIHEGFGEYRLDGIETRFLNVATSKLPPLTMRDATIVDL